MLLLKKLTIFYGEKRSMEKDFRYFRDKYGDAGARDKFEKTCVQLLQTIYGSDAHSIKASPGDEGIDVLIGDFSEPIEVYQCKFFIEGIGDAQKQQIRESFNTASESKEYKMKKWILCIPDTMTPKEFSWWSNWKAKRTSDTGVPIELYDGSLLLLKLKKYDLYNDIFDEDDKIALGEIADYFTKQKKKIVDEIAMSASDIDSLYNDLLFVKKLEMANIEDIEQCKNEFFNAEYAKQVIKSKGDEEQITAFNNLQTKIQSLWSTQYRLFKDDNDGNLLLAKTYERIEDADSASLDCSPILPEAGLIVKKGILHQLAEECSVGWLQNYKTKLESLLNDGEKQNV